MNKPTDRRFAPHRQDNGVRARPIRDSKAEWGYDGRLHEPDRRISIHPEAMSHAARAVSPEALACLFRAFLFYWQTDIPDPVDYIGREYGFSRRRRSSIVAELQEAELIFVWGDDRFAPAGPFGAAAPREQPKSKRCVPRDWLEIRDAVFERDGYGCVHCGSGRDLHCDHVEPLALGGSNDPNNLVTACASCNLSKGSKTVAEWRPDIAARTRR